MRDQGELIRLEKPILVADERKRSEDKNFLE